MRLARHALSAGLLTAALGALASPASAATKLGGCTALTAPGSYVLTKNIVATGSQPCFSISANNVTLDLAGHSVTSASKSGDGVVVIPGTNAVPRTGIHIKHGTIGSFVVGIRATATAGILIEDVGSSVNREQGVLAGAGAVLLNVQARQNGTDGARLGAGSFVSHGLFDSNQLSGVFAGSGSSVFDSSATFNHDGIVVASPFAAAIERNDAEGNTVNGVLIDCPAFVDSNAPAKFFKNGANDILARQTDVLMPGSSFSSIECPQLQPGSKLTKSRIDGFPDR